MFDNLIVDHLEADLDDEWRTPKAGWKYAGVKPYEGRFWAYSLVNLRSFAQDGLLHHRDTGMPRLKLYADEAPGISLQDFWDDIPPIGAKAAERLGYPTQKPVALLERIIQASSNPGGLVLDPFCGCGTAAVAAQKLGRQWVGIDITYLAIALIKQRLLDTFGPEVVPEVHGEPTSLPDALALAKEDKYQFQFWVVEKILAKPVEHKKGADHGIDGRLLFLDGPGEVREVVLSVKAERYPSTSAPYGTSVAS